MCMKKVLTYILLCLALAGCSTDDTLPLSPLEEQEGAPFQWTRAEDVETHQQFLRNFGLGYSYDAVSGNYCDWQDIRCQVLNRYWVENMSETLLHTNTARTTQLKSKFYYSLHDYVADVTITTSEAIDIGLYNGEKHRRHSFIEEGKEEMFYFILEEKNILAHSFVDYASLLALYSRYKNNKNILTKSFVGAIEHLGKTSDENNAAVDSFLNVYGTHVIVSATMGGRLKIDLMNSMWKYRDQARETEWTLESILNNQKQTSNQTDSETYQWLEQARLNIMATGGDQSSLNGILGEYRSNGTRDFSTEGIDIWRKSLTYDADNEQNSNVDLVDMQVIPIWEFAEVVDPWVALRIKAAVLRDAAVQQKLLGEVNFFDVSFPVQYNQASCSYRNAEGGWSQATVSDNEEQPLVVNIVSGGRYVATVCHEKIEGRQLWVCYPIYEGKVKQTNGLGVAEDGNLYNVYWLNGKVTLTPREDLKAGDRFYITGGTVTVAATEGVQYAESYSMPYIEIGGGVQPDGTYKGIGCYQVVKENDIFCFYADRNDLPIVGWTPVEGIPARYVRNANYTYIYNPSEIKAK